MNLYSVLRQKLIFLVAGMLLLLFAQFSIAGTLQYSAKLQDSSWELSQNSRLQCTLSHQIPRYGAANFSAKANRKLNMSFELDMLLLPDTYALATIRSEPPNWRPGASGRPLGNMKLYKQFNAGLPKEIAWTMLSELEQGMNPTFYYGHWHNKRDEISVGLSSAKFKHAYNEFVHCVSNLLNYSFDDIAYTVLNYQSNSDEFTVASKARFKKIQEFLSLDHGIELVLVDAYADSYDGRSKNLQLSKRRAKKIKEYFIKSGIDEKRIEADGHGERRHIATNANTLGRGENRRVVIQMENVF